MKKLSSVLLCAVMINYAHAQDATNTTDIVSKETTLENINWSKLINRDEVALGTFSYNLHNIDKNTVVRLRFYHNDAAMSGFNSRYKQGENIPFTQTEGGKVVAVQADNGGYAVYISAGDNESSFNELLSLRDGSSISFFIRGNVADLTAKSDKKKKRY